MKCDEMTERLTDRLNGTLEGAAMVELDRHLAACDRCRNEAAAIESLWQRMGDFDEEVPSARMRARFDGALDAYREGRRGRALGRLVDGLERLWPRQPIVQFGLALGALAIGLLLGGRVGPGQDGSGDATRAEIRALRDQMELQVQSMHRTVSLSLLEHQSASERLRGVEWSVSADPDDLVVAALLHAVRADPSVNVRMAAIEALGALVDRPAVGRELLRVLERPAPDLVRVGLAEVLLVGEVAGSGPAVERLIDDAELDPSVQSYLQELMRRSG